MRENTDDPKKKKIRTESGAWISASYKSNAYPLFIFFLHTVLRPFQDYFSSYETGQSVGGQKLENPEKINLAHPQAEPGLFQVASAGLEPTPDTAVN